MKMQLIIFGAGRNGDDAWNFFGSENIFCFVDNNKRLIGTKLRDKKVISIEELKSIRDKQTKEFDESYEIIVSVSKTRWATLAIVNQLQRIGISDYSIYMDIRRRWESGEKFIMRDRSQYPHEQETILEIYCRQFDYLMRHTDASHLLPATGSLRKVQRETVQRANDFFDSIESIGISPFMIAGTLIGALRHQGFIPWDDDLDFALIYDDYVRLYDYLEKHSKIFYHCGNDVWETKQGERSCSRNYRYIAAYGLGYMQIYENMEAPHVKENLFITDIMPVYYFADDYTLEQYGRDYERWYRKREENYIHVDEIYLREAKREGTIVDFSKRVGLGHDFTSFLKSQHEINGKQFDRKIWDADILFPLRKLMFEGFEWYAPKYAKEWLETEGYGDPMRLPPRVGVYVHDKDRIFREKY